MAGSTLERFATSRLEHSPHTVPCRSKSGKAAHRALAKASWELGGCGCGGPPVAGVAAGLSLYLGREALHQSGIRPPVGRRRVEPTHLHERRLGRRPGPSPPRNFHPPQSQRLPAHGDQSPVVGPPLFQLGGEEFELGQLKHLHPLFQGGGRLPPFPPGQLR